MPVVRVVETLARADIILQDSNIRWPLTELQYWLNDAYRSIVMMRPDANMKSGTFNCAVGTRQVLTVGFPTALRLRAVTRNVAASSNKRAIRLVPQTVLDDQRPGWHDEPGTVNIEHYCYDPLLPKEFLVYPPATAAAQIEVVYSSAPAGHTLSEAQLSQSSGDTTTIQLDDVYAGPILDYILYRAYAKDAEYAANAERAAGHYQAFVAAVTAGTQSDTAAAPTVSSRVT